MDQQLAKRELLARLDEQLAETRLWLASHPGHASYVSALELIVKSEWVKVGLLRLGDGDSDGIATA